MVSRLGCANDSSWKSLPGWTAYMKTTYRRADIVYSQQNGTIRAYDFAHHPSKNATIIGAELLQVFDAALSGKSNYSSIATGLQIIGRKPNPPVIPLFIWWFFERLSDLSPSSRASSARAITALQALLVTPIYYSTSKGWAELRSIGYGKEVNLGALLLSQFPAAEPDTPIYPTEQRYIIVVGRGTLIAYGVLGGVCLAFCFLALLFTSIRSRSEMIGERSPFPTMDFKIMCELQNDKHHPISNEDSGKLREQNTRKLISALSRMYVVPAHGLEVQELDERPSSSEG